MKFQARLILSQCNLSDFSPCLGARPRNRQLKNLIVEVLAARIKFLEISCCCTVINCTFIFRGTKLFGCVMVSFEPLKRQFSNQTAQFGVIFKFRMEWSSHPPPYYQPQWVPWTALVTWYTNIAKYWKKIKLVLYLKFWNNLIYCLFLN